MKKFKVYFDKMKDAREAVFILKNAGYKSAHLDSAGGFFEEFSEEISFIGNDPGPSLSNTALKSGTCKDHLGKASMVASNPMVSGVGSFEHMADTLNACLVVSVPDEKITELKQQLTEIGIVVGND